MYKRICALCLGAGLLQAVSSCCYPAFAEDREYVSEMMAPVVEFVEERTRRSKIPVDAIFDKGKQVSLFLLNKGENAY